MNAQKLYDTAANLPSGSSVLGMAYDYDGWLRVHTYERRGPDGHPSTVYCSRMPAIFFKIECDELGLTLTTGSSAHDLVHRICTAIADGMLSS